MLYITRFSWSEFLFLVCYTLTQSNIISQGQVRKYSPFIEVANPYPNVPHYAFNDSMMGNLSVVYFKLGS